MENKIKLVTTNITQSQYDELKKIAESHNVRICEIIRCAIYSVIGKKNVLIKYKNKIKKAIDG